MMHFVMHKRLLQIEYNVIIILYLTSSQLILELTKISSTLVLTGTIFLSNDSRVLIYLNYCVILVLFDS